MTINKINKLSSCKIALVKYSWDELAIDLINLEKELYNLKAFLSPKKIKLLKTLISLYEKEKLRRISTGKFNPSTISEPREMVAFDMGE